MKGRMKKRRIWIVLVVALLLAAGADVSLRAVLQTSEPPRC